MALLGTKFVVLMVGALTAGSWRDSQEGQVEKKGANAKTE